MEVISWVIISIYTLCLVFILMYSIGQFTLSILGRKKKAADPSLEEKAFALPMVTIQLPIYNEKYVASRLIKACAEIDYPKDRLEIQVLDDSNDETIGIVHGEVQKYRSMGVDIEQIRRTDRSGFKAGALKYGLERAKGDLIAIFDADFVPPKKFVKKAITNFLEPEVGMVQFAWGHINSEYSKLTRLQAFGLEAHFHVEQKGKAQGGLFLNFNGTAGMWRKECIIDAGNWHYDTLTEDLDLSYRAQLKGWKFKYVDDLEAPAELPIEMNAFRSQQFRWTKGAAETSKKMLPRVLSARLPARIKLFSALHLLNSVVFISSFLLAVLSVPALGIKHMDQSYSMFFDLANVFLVSLLLLGVYFFSAAKRSRYFNGSLRNFILEFPVFLSAMMGLSFHNSVAAIEGWIGKKSPFIRTPKFDAINSGSKKGNKYVNTRIPLIAYFEVVLVFYFAGGVLLGFWLGDLALSPYHLLLVLGFSMISYWSFRDARIFKQKA